MPADQFHAVKALFRKGGISGKLHFFLCIRVFFAATFVFKEIMIYCKQNAVNNLHDYVAASPSLAA
jgi:hypothetical protein